MISLICLMSHEDLYTYKSNFITYTQLIESFVEIISVNPLRILNEF